jgi:hypothetical protein
MRIVADVETTGLGSHGRGTAREDGIIAVGLSWRGSDNLIHSMMFEANPGERFYTNGRAADAFKVNGYTEAQVRNFVPAERVASQLREALNGIAKNEKQPIRLEAYNQDFDRDFLTQPPWNLTDFEWGTDIMRRAIDVMKFGNGHLSLAKAITFAGIKFDGKAHQADVDTKAELLLAEWLDRQDTAGKDRYDLDDIAKDIRDYVMLHQEPPKLTEKERAPDPLLCFASQLTHCPLEEWREWHGGPKKDWSRWSATKGSLGNYREAHVVGLLENAGLKVYHRQKWVMDEATHIGGFIDGAIVWPLNNGTLYPIEIKSAKKGFQESMDSPEHKYLLQFETYLRAMDREVGYFVYVGMVKNEDGEIMLRPYRRNDALWAEAQRLAEGLRAVRKPDAPEVECTCGWCHRTSQVR